MKAKFRPHSRVLRSTLHAPRSTLYTLSVLGAWIAVSITGCKPSNSSQLDPSLVGKEFGAFAFKPIDGESSTSNGALKGKVVVIDFFATWCDPCLRALPRLAELDRTGRERGLALLGVSLDREPRLLRALMTRHGAAYPVGLRSDNEALTDLVAGFSPEGLIPPIPTLVILDRQGRLQALYVGLGPNDAFLPKISEKVESLLRLP